MDQKELQQKIAESYSTLSPQAQKIFASMEWMKVIEDLHLEHALTDEQMGLLATETTLVLLGIIHMNEYESMLREKLGQPKEIIDLILKELQDKVFTLITSDLAVAHEKNITLGKESNPLNIHPILTTLPAEIQEAIQKSNYKENLYTISVRHKLPINKMAILEDATVRFMAGQMAATEYEQKLLTDIGGDRNDIKKIVDEVNSEVLLVIRKFMKGEPAAPEVRIETIPKPPYKKESSENKNDYTSTINSLPKTQSGILANAGIEMMEEENTNTKDGENISKKEGGVLSESGINVIDDIPRPSSHVFASNMTRKNTLDGIENPTRTNPNIAMEKLQNPTTSTQSTTNYSIPRMSGDQYREPIE